MLPLANAWPRARYLSSSAKLKRKEGGWWVVGGGGRRGDNSPVADSLYPWIWVPAGIEGGTCLRFQTRVLRVFLVAVAVVSRVVVGLEFGRVWVDVLALVSTLVAIKAPILCWSGSRLLRLALLLFFSTTPPDGITVCGESI